MQCLSVSNQRSVDVNIYTISQSYLNKTENKTNKTQNTNTITQYHFLIKKNQLSSPSWHMTITAWELPKERRLAETLLNFCLTETIQPNKATCLNLLCFIVTCYTWIDNYTDYKKYNKEHENCQKMTQHIWKWTKQKV